MSFGSRELSFFSLGPNPHPPSMLFRHCRSYSPPTKTTPSTNKSVLQINYIIWQSIFYSNRCCYHLPQQESISENCVCSSQHLHPPIMNSIYWKATILGVTKTRINNRWHSERCTSLKAYTSLSCIDANTITTSSNYSGHKVVWGY